MYGYKEEEKEKDTGIKIGGHSKDSITLNNLEPEEAENLEGMVHNHFWVTVTDGRLEAIRRKDQIPSPTEDEEMLPFWRRATPGNQQVQLFDIDIPKFQSPSIIIQHLCGYNYTPENYKIVAEALESYGFECLRSRRGNDARFSEIWLLSGLWSARGELREVFGDSKGFDNKDLNKAVRFLCKSVQFGTLDVSFQRAAMQIPD